MNSKRVAVPGRRLPRAAITTLSVILLALGILGPAGPARADPFADAAFEVLWQRTDLHVATGAISRTWIWGPLPGPARQEPYAEVAGGMRAVQYFDKGRMEINNPQASPDDTFYITSGLLTVELISGMVQVGNATFESRLPARIPVAGDRDDQNAPTYASFQAVADLPNLPRGVEDNTGAPANQAIARGGQVGPLPQGKSDYGVVYAQYVPETSHNIADVFWEFLNSEGMVLVDGEQQTRPLFDPWFKETGYPISEAYWATVAIDGRPMDVLMQPFQRRVLTYVPNGQEGWRVEMGNIGLHYLEWRYAVAAPVAQGPAPPAPPAAAGPLPVAITSIEIGKQNLDLNSQSVTIVNNGSQPVNMGGWRLDSPKPNHADVYNFPAGFTLAPGATVTVYGGHGTNGPDRLYMRRVTWLFLSNGYDAVLLYDAAGREVSRYVLQEGVAPPQPPPPTLPPTATPQATPTEAEETGEPTEPVPSPTPSVTPTGGTVTTTATPAGTGTPTTTPSATPTVTGTPPTATPTVTGTPPTATRTATATATPVP